MKHGNGATTRITDIIKRLIVFRINGILSAVWKMLHYWRIDIKKYLCPIRCISFDGFVTYEGRRFGIPYSYVKHLCRVQRENFTLYVYDLELRKILITHDVTWSRKDSFCKDQFVDEQPEEKPSVPIKISISQKEMPEVQLSLRHFRPLQTESCYCKSFFDISIDG